MIQITSIQNNEIRNGNFTSSRISELMTFNAAKTDFGAPAKKYIHEKNRERKLGRSLKLDKYSRPAAWGHFVGELVHEMLNSGYESVGDLSIKHPKIPFWVGSPDSKNVREKVVADIKCYEPENFSDYVDVLTEAHKTGNTELFKKERPEEFWQLISGACLLDMDFIEAIVYIPYMSELKDIQAMVSQYQGLDVWKYRFIENADYSELAYIPDGGYYKNLNIFRFEAKKEDKDFLTSRVIEAGKLLINPTKP